MSAGTNVIAATLIAYAGFALLALAMHRHAGEMLPRPASAGTCRLARLCGSGLLLAALIPCVVSTGMSVGTAAWFGALTIAALALGLTLTYLPRQAPRAACTALAGTVILLVWQAASA